MKAHWVRLHLKLSLIEEERGLIDHRPLYEPGIGMESSIQMWALGESERAGGPAPFW